MSRLRLLLIVALLMVSPAAPAQDLDSEAERAVLEGAIFFRVMGQKGGVREVLLHPDGRIAVGEPALSYVATRGVTAVLPHRETKAIFAELVALRDRLRAGKRSWIDHPRTYDDLASVTLAFADGGHVGGLLDKPVPYLQHDYFAILSALLPYADSTALLGRAARIRIRVAKRPSWIYVALGDDSTKWPAEIQDGASMSPDEWTSLRAKLL